MGMARSITAVEAGGRTRVVLNLVKLVPYEVETVGNKVAITLEGAGASGTAAFPARGADDAPPDPASRTYAVRFMRIAYSSCGWPELPGSQGIGLHISLLLGI